MNGIPKNRFSGLIIIIVLSLILAMGLFTMLSRYSNEQRIIKRGFVTLKQNAGSIKSKLRVMSIYNYSKAPKKNKIVSFTDRGIIVNFDTGAKVNSIYDRIVNDTLTIAGSFFSDILDKSFFDEYIIFDSTRLFYKSFDAELLDMGGYLGVLKKNFYLPASFRIFSGKKDSARIRATWNTGFISRSIINYNKYYQFVYPLKINNYTWYISGLMTNKNYLEKKQHIETWLLILIGILLIFTLFSFQFIKLSLLSKTERIKTSDLVLICFSISGIACILPLLILNIYTLSGIKVNTEKQLKNLSDSIKGNFIAELNLMYKTTKAYELYKQKDFPVVKNVLTNTGWQRSNKELLKVFWNYPYFKGLFGSRAGWTDDIITTWKTDTFSRITYRQYYQRKDEWLLPGSSEGKRFRLQSIYSNTSGEVSAVLAKPSEKYSDTVYCISTPMYSIMNTVLPPGFEFRIIGKDGMVWFHSDQKKNYRENFLDECDHNAEIEEAIVDRVEISVPLKISLKNHQAHISPIGTLPLYLVTLCNTVDQNKILSHSNYILLIFILLGLFCGLIATALFYYEKLSKTAGNAENYDDEPGIIWLLHNTQKNERYMIIFGLNFILGLFLAIPGFMKGTTVIHFLLILFSGYSVFFIYSYFLLKNFKKKVFKISVPVAFSIVIILCNIVYVVCLSNYILFLAIELTGIIIAGIVVFLVLKNQPSENKFRAGFLPEPWQKKLDFTDYPFIPYVLFVFSWIIISCVLPTIILFKIALREERELSTKEDQIRLAAKIERKNLQIDSFYIAHIYPEKNPDPGGELFLNTLKTRLKYKGNYLLNLYALQPMEGYKEKSLSVVDRDTGFLILNRYLRQMIQREDIRSYHMFHSAGLDTMWYWTGGRIGRANCDTLEFYYSARQKNAKGASSNYQIKLSSFLPDQEGISKSSRYFQLSVVLLFLVFLFLFIQIVIKKLFIVKIPAMADPIIVSDDTKIRGKIFLINSLRQDHIKDVLLKYCTLLSPDLPLELKSSGKTLLIFNPLPETMIKWSPVIAALDKSIETTTGDLILLSCYSPWQIRNMIEEQIFLASVPGNKEALKELRYMLIRLFSFFQVYFVKDETPEKELFNLQYQYLWEKCTMNEKFILSDLATDSVINNKNREDIINLIGKGILEVKGRLRFVTKGFKLFVMELADTEEFINLEKNSKRADGWGKIRTPLYLIFGAVVVFFVFTQQDYITMISGTILSISGLLGALLKFGLFGGKTPDSGK